MCTSPSKIRSGVTVACRVCNECVALRIDDWAWRCAAETESFPFGLSIGLTYDGSAKSADGARAFRYLDIRRFLAALRDAAAREAREQGRPRPVVRFLVAGEVGSRKKRVHWHMLLWSDFPLTDLGQWGLFKAHVRLGRLPSDGVAEGCEVPHRHEERLVWSLWPFGHVYTEALTFASARYALKYVTKNQFSNEQSRGTARDGGGDNVAASYFRMSKRPPIGAAFLAEWLDRNLERGQIPPDFNVKVGQNPGYWHLKGEMRKWALSALALEIADGDAPAGTEAFRQRAKNTEWGRNDLRFIREVQRGEKEKKWGEQEPDPDEWQRHSERVKRDESAKGCYRAIPCRACAAGAGDAGREDVLRKIVEIGRRENDPQRFRAALAGSGRRLNRHCGLGPGYERSHLKDGDGWQDLQAPPRLKEGPQWVRWVAHVRALV